MAEWLSCKSITGVDVCLDLGFGFLMVEGPLALVGPGIGVELVSQSPCKEFHFKYAEVCIDDVVGDVLEMVKRNFCFGTKKK